MEQLIIELNQEEQEFIYGGESRLRFINGKWEVVVDNPG
jgi:hypothetical protein